MLEKTSGLLAVDDRSKEDIEQEYSVLLGEKVALDSVRRLIVTHGCMKTIRLRLGMTSRNTSAVHEITSGRKSITISPI